MGRHQSFDTEEAFGAATRLFWAKGYERTSLADLTSAIGIAPASFYHAFGSKEALFRRVVDRYIALQREAFDRAFETPRASDAIAALLRGYADVVTSPLHAPGCLVVNSGPASRDHDPLRRWLSLHREDLRKRLERRFEGDIAKGTLSADCDTYALARFVMTLAGGLAVEAQAGAKKRDLYAMIEFALRDLSLRTESPLEATRKRVRAAK